MVIPITCANVACRRPLRLNDDLAGKHIKCPQCSQVMRVPFPGESSPPAGPVPVPGARPEPTAPPAEGATGSPPDRVPARRSRAWKGAVVVAVVAALGGAAYLGLAYYFERRARQQCANNLAQIGIAFHQHHETYKYLPAAICDRGGKPLLSWRVALLPFLEQEPLYRRFNLAEPWDSRHNKALLGEMPAIFAPVRGAAEPSSTRYRLFVGPKALFENLASRASFARIPDAKKTFLVVEAAEAVPWTKPEGLPYDDGKPLPGLGGTFGGGYYAVYCVGTPRFIRRDTPEHLLRALITPGGGEAVPPELQAPSRFTTGDY